MYTGTQLFHGCLGCLIRFNCSLNAHETTVHCWSVLSFRFDLSLCITTSTYLLIIYGHFSGQTRLEWDTFPKRVSILVHVNCVRIIITYLNLDCFTFKQFNIWLWLKSFMQTTYWTSTHFFSLYICVFWKIFSCKSTSFVKFICCRIFKSLPKLLIEHTNKGHRSVASSFGEQYRYC